jgi:hypothetical protein
MLPSGLPGFVHTAVREREKGKNNLAGIVEEKKI